MFIGLMRAIVIAQPLQKFIVMPNVPCEYEQEQHRLAGGRGGEVFPGPATFGGPRCRSKNIVNGVPDGFFLT